MNDNSPEDAEIFYVYLTPNHNDHAGLGSVTVVPRLGTVTIIDNDGKQ